MKIKHHSRVKKTAFILLAQASELKAGNKVAILGFGTFSVNEKAARTGLNPRTKESIVIPAHNVAKFKPSNELNDSLN